MAQRDNRTIEGPAACPEPVAVINGKPVAEPGTSRRIDPDPCGGIVGRGVAHRRQPPIYDTVQDSVPGDQVVSLEIAMQPDWRPEKRGAASHFPESMGATTVYLIGDAVDGRPGHLGQVAKRDPRLPLLTPASGAPVTSFR